MRMHLMAIFVSFIVCCYQEEVKKMITETTPKAQLPGKREIRKDLDEPITSVKTAEKNGPSKTKKITRRWKNSEIAKHSCAKIDGLLLPVAKKYFEIENNNKKIAGKMILMNSLEPRRRRRRSASPSSVDINCTSPLLSCKGRCLNKRDAGGTQDRRCSCDPYCNYFEDCCADYVKYCLGERYMNTTAHRKVPDEQWTCRLGIWMIASCPKSWTNPDVNMSCIAIRWMTPDNYKNVIPVVTANNKTYANRFCAQCNGFIGQQIKFYALHFLSLVTPPSQATEREKINFLLKFCEIITIKPRDDTPRRYCYSSVGACAENYVSEKIQRNCVNGSYGLVHDKQFYTVNFKNVYCGYCNYITMNELQCGPDARLGIPRSRKNIWQSQTKHFSLIMDVGQVSSQARKYDLLSCPRGMVCDIYLETCRDGKHPTVPVVSKLKKYRVALWIKIINVNPNQEYPSNLLFNDEYFISFFSKAMIINANALASVKITCLDCYYEFLYLIEFDLDITTYKSNGKEGSSSLFALFLEKKGFVMKSTDYSFKAIKITTMPLTCVQIDTYSSNEYQVLQRPLSSVFINKTSEVLAVRDYFSNNTKIIGGTMVPVGDIVVCRQMLSFNCSGIYIFLQQHEYVISPNRSVLYNASGHLYEYGTYMWKNGTIMICTNFTTTYKQSHSNAKSEDKVLTILTYIGLSLSVLCLLFVLVRYSLFADLRTIPGINLMNLSSALLMAQVLWLIGSGLTFTRLGCTVIAIVLHYSFLASFSWMSIIAFETWRDFSSKTSTHINRGDKRRKRKKIVSMMAVGWLPLVVYLSLCVALDQSGTVAIGYGGDKGCWINNPWANLYFFAIPVAISILWNAVFFVLIIKEIRKVIDQSQMVTNRHQARKDSRVYARIAVLMGFTWVFGFMVPFTSYYLMYPFVILNTSQGLYIAMAFGFNKRVRAMYKNIGTKKGFGYFIKFA